MAASDTLGLIVAGAIGAGGAITAQVISSVVNSRKDSKRFDWEREKQERDWKMQEAERFLALKQQLYSEYINQAEKLLRYINLRIENNETASEADLEGMKRLGELWSSISLIAPRDVRDAIDRSHEKSMNAVLDAQNEGLPPDDRRESYLKAGKAWADGQRAMREDLIGEKHRFFNFADESQKKDPPPAWMLPWWRRTARRILRKNPV